MRHGVEFDLILLNGFSQVDNEAFAFALPDRTRVHVEEFGRADISDTEAQRLEVAKGFTWPALWAAMMAPLLFVDGTWSISSTGNQLFAFTPLLAMLPGAAAEAWFTAKNVWRERCMALGFALAKWLTGCGFYFLVLLFIVI